MHPWISRDKGFTLIELLVVMGIVAMLFFLTLPQVGEFGLVEPSKRVASLISRTCQDLKARARKERRTFRLSIASGTGEVWVDHTLMDEKEMAKARSGAFTLPEEVGVSFVSGRVATDKETGVQSILFYPQGYSDPAIFAVRSEEKTLLVQVEPLLLEPLIVESKGL